VYNEGHIILKTYLLGCIPSSIQGIFLKLSKYHMASLAKKLCKLLREVVYNLLKPTSHVMHHQFNINNCTLCPHCIYVFGIF
jgi:hypothetical protein